MTATLHLLYGMPPRGLVEIPAEAQQCSPLMPGSLRLGDITPGSAVSAVIYTPPGTIERQYVLARALEALAVGAPLTTLAPKDKGGSRIAGELKALGCLVNEDSRSHHKIVTTVRPKTLIGTAEAIAQGGLRQYPLHGLWTMPGVFSWDRLDAGSAVLLRHLPKFSGNGADLGCGIGVLARAVLEAADVRGLTLVDIDRRAITAANKNITDTRAQFVWMDIREGVLPATGLDFIVTNPPFHDTGIEDKALGQVFLQRAAAMLKPGGTLWCVANRHLPYEALLEEHFTKVAQIADEDGYKIIRAER